MKVLGIECTAHTLSVGIVDYDYDKTGHDSNARVLSNVIDTYHGGDEGLIPRKMADHHADVFAKVLGESLNQAHSSIEDIDIIAFSQGPGIGAPLSVGIAAAKYLALCHNKKLVGVNHCYAHAKISEYMCNAKTPLILYLSGGNSQLLIEDVGVEGTNVKGTGAIVNAIRGQKSSHYHYDYNILGETLDIGIGNLFDNFARAIKMKQAHGSALATLASGGKYLPLPYSVKGMNLVFSGLLTAAEKAARTHSACDVAFSLMETAFAMTCEVTERALFLTNKKHLVVCGGVAQNRRLQEMLKVMCHDAGVKFGVAPDEFNRDNGAMIAYAGVLLYEKYGAMPVEKCVPVTNYRIDRMKEILG